MSKRTNKYLYLYIIQGNYNYCGWEDLCADDQTPQGYRRIRADLKLYRQNEPEYPHRLIRRREINPDYEEVQS